jgi:DNA-binding response OmpR family regulator
VKILIVEDEESIGRAIVRGLVEEGHQADLVTRGETAKAQAEDIGYDAIVLDWALPDLDGLSVLRAWRERGLTVPVLMLTARGTTKERVAGLRTGADDYLVKPFDFAELLARLEALHRRTSGQLESAKLGSVELDGRRRTLKRARDEATLTPREFALAKELFSHAGEVLSRTHLLTSVWGTDFEGDANVLDVYVGYLRKKLERVGADDVVLKAVRGVGFRLAVAKESA